MSNKFQSVTGFITETTDANGVDRLAVELLVDGAKDCFVYDVPDEVLKQIMTGGLPLGSLTHLRPYNSVLNNTFGWRQGISKFVQGDASLLAKVESVEAKPVMREESALTEAEAQARIDASKAAKAAAAKAKRDAEVAAAAAKAAATPAPTTAV